MRKTSCRCSVVRGVKTHDPGCPEVVWLQDVARALAPDLEQMAKQRRRAEAAASEIQMC